MKNKYKRFEREKIERLKCLVKPEAFYAKELSVSLKPNESGWSEAGLCIFHTDNQAGSFRVKVEVGAFKCFVCLVKGKDIISFTQRRYNLTFYEALLKISAEWGVIL